MRREKSSNFTQNAGKIRKNYIGKFRKILWTGQGNLSASNNENPAKMIALFK